MSISMVTTPPSSRRNKPEVAPKPSPKPAHRGGLHSFITRSREDVSEEERGVGGTQGRDRDRGGGEREGEKGGVWGSGGGELEGEVEIEEEGRGRERRGEYVTF